MYLMTGTGRGTLVGDSSNGGKLLVHHIGPCTKIAPNLKQSQHTFSVRDQILCIFHLMDHYSLYYNDLSLLSLC